MTLEIQVLRCVSVMSTFKNGLDSITWLNFYQDCQLFCISPTPKTLVFNSIFTFCSICQLFRHSFFTLLSFTPFLYMQPLNWIIGIINKNNTSLLLINPVEVVHLRLHISKIIGRVELFFSRKTVTETYVRHNMELFHGHMNNDCCLYIIAEI